MTIWNIVVTLFYIKRKEKEMSSVLKIGNLTLNMGNMSHVLGVTKNNIDTYMKYATYQSSFEKGNK